MVGEDQAKNINTILISIIEKGAASPLLEEFINICVNISLIYFRNSRFKSFLREKTGLTDKDIAIDLIADLFKEKKGIYYQFNEFFKKDKFDLKNTDEDVVKAKLYSLLVSSTKQNISEIRGDYDEIYFKVKKAIDIAVDRNNDEFMTCRFRNDIYIHNSYSRKINFKNSFIIKEELLFELYGCDFNTRSIPEIMRKCLNILENKKKYCNAIEYSQLTNCITEYYKNRLSDYLGLP